MRFWPVNEMTELVSGLLTPPFGDEFSSVRGSKLVQGSSGSCLKTCRVTVNSWMWEPQLIERFMWTEYLLWSEGNIHCRFCMTVCIKLSVFEFREYHLPFPLSRIWRSRMFSIYLSFMNSSTEFVCYVFVSFFHNLFKLWGKLSS
jgi:hypothetical protein